MLKFTAILWALLLPFYAHAQADTVQGYDAIGLARYCKQYLAAPKLPGLSTLLRTFGDPLPCIEKRINQGGLTLVQVDLIDATCWRNNVCPPGTKKPDDLKELEARAKEVNRLAVKYPAIEWWISPALEHDVKDRNKVEQMMAAVKKGCPTCHPINSPFSGAVDASYPLEKHGTTSYAFSISGDGQSSFDADTFDSDCTDPAKQKCTKFNHATSGRKSTFVWFNELNLRCTGEDSFTPPLKRTARPTADLFAQAYRIMQPEELRAGPPAQCKSVREVNGRAGEIYKPNAEAYCNGQKPDSRGNKPLLIISRRGGKGEQLSVLSRHGKRIGAFKFYGSFTQPGLYRWYMGDASGQTPAQLYKAAGGEWAFLDLGKGACLRFNTVRRMGKYR